MTARPIYPGGNRTETAFIVEVKFTGEQIRILAAICAEPEFIEGLRQIANRVHAEKILTIEVTKPQEIATLKDVIESASKLLEKLEEMPGRVDSILWKAQDHIEEAKRALTVITAVGKDEIKKIENKPKSEGGRPRKDNARSIASLAKKHFERFNLDTSGTTWPKGDDKEDTSISTWPENWKYPLIDALEIIYDAAGDPRNKKALLEYPRTRRSRRSKK